MGACSGFAFSVVCPPILDVIAVQPLSLGKQCEWCAPMPQVKVRRRGSDEKFVASVLAVGTECDIGETLRWKHIRWCSQSCSIQIHRPNVSQELTQWHLGASGELTNDVLDCACVLQRC